MIVLHASFCDGSIVLWAEADHRSRKQRSSPFDPGQPGLAATLTAAFSNVELGEPSPYTAWLPSTAAGPVPSLFDQQLTASSALAPWTVTGCRLSAENAAAVLSECSGKTALGSGILAGKGICFFAQVFRFAASLVARQQFLPSIRSANKKHRSVWEPVIMGADSKALATLAKSMPHSCVALGKRTKPPRHDASSVIEGVITALVDALVRSACASSRDGATTVHDEWLNSLRSAEPAIDAYTECLASLENNILEWSRPIRVASSAPVRLCFQLSEPENGGVWRVSYLLQGTKDPSILMPVEQAWSATGDIASLIKPGDATIRQHTLASLGQAAGICQWIHEGLKARVPCGQDLDIATAYQFLAENAVALEQAGFGVMLPARWTGKSLRPQLRADVKAPPNRGGGVFSLSDVLSFNWELALGDEKVSADELAALAAMKVPLVNLRGQWVLVDADQIKTALKFWKSHKQGRATAQDIIKMAFGRPANLPVEVNGVKATGWLGDVIKQMEDGSFEELPAPHDFAGTLRPYQLRGYSWLSFLRMWGLGGCLADDMGLGKTIQALAFIQSDYAKTKRPALVVCPTSVVSNWKKETNRFTSLKVMVHHGADRAKGAKFKEQAARHAIVISSYALLHRDAEALGSVQWAGIVLDEAQNIKNPDTKQARAAAALSAEYRMALTGTPVENGVSDLWSIMDFLNSGLLGTRAEFTKAFLLPIQAERDDGVMARLKRVTGPFILRRLKTDKSVITDLPEKMEMKVYCNLTKEQASLYAAIVEDVENALDAAEGIQRRGIILAALVKLKQACNHPAHFLKDSSPLPGRSGKLARLCEMLEEVLASGEKALVFTQFAEMGALLQKHLRETFGRDVLFLHGGTPKQHRDTMLERFQQDDGPPLFILSLKAGGLGLNLVTASHVFHFDRWWNPAVEDQATDRAYRIGQTKNVQVHKFICAGTMEERIDELIERKKKVSRSIVGTGEAWLTELSTKELKELFALRNDAIGE